MACARGPGRGVKIWGKSGRTASLSMCNLLFLKLLRTTEKNSRRFGLIRTEQRGTSSAGSRHAPSNVAESVERLFARGLGMIKVAPHTPGVFLQQFAHAFEAGRLHDETNMVRLIHAPDDLGIRVG